MLEGLDRIDWTKLKHAYGEASDVPGLIRDLLSRQNKVRSNAMSELFGNIWHQGTVYEASSYAVPFLQELLRSPETPDKIMIADLLAELAAGSPSLDSSFQDEGMDQWMREALADEGLDFDQELIESQKYADATREAVGKELALLYPYLTCEEPEVRRSVSVALQHYPQYAAETIPLLETALAAESDEEAGEAMEESIEILKESYSHDAL